MPKGFQKIRVVAPMVVAVLSVAAMGSHLGIGIKFADLNLSNVNPGSMVNLREVKNLPYVISNRSNFGVEVFLEPEIPKNTNRGYEPIPKAEWITMVPNRFRLAPGDVGVAEVVLKVPDDMSLSGKKYQVNLHAHTLPVNTIALSVTHSVTFSVGDKGEVSPSSLFSTDFDMTPTLRLKNVPVGKKISFTDCGVSAFKLVNKGDVPVFVHLKSETSPTIIQDSEWKTQGDPSWLTPKDSTVSVKKNKIHTTDFFLKIPNSPKNYGEKFFFLIVGEVEQSRTRLYSRIYVETELTPSETSLK